MKPYEFIRFYHPKSGKFVYKRKGSGLIVDNIFKPLKSVVSSVFKKFAKPVGKKALEAGISPTGERLGKKISEKSGDLVMKKLQNMRGKSKQSLRPTPISRSYNPKKEEESTDMILNRLISGNGIKRKRKIM